MDDTNTQLPEADDPPALRGPRRFPWLWLGLALGLAACFPLDHAVMWALRPLLGTPFNHFVDQWIRPLGNGKLLIPVLLLLIATGVVARDRPVWRSGAWGLLAFALSGLACNIIKVLTHRARPWVTDPPPDHWLGYLRAHDYQSFPSGDVSTIFAIALVIAYFLPKTRVPLLIIGVLVALERMVLGAHHLSDVWAGAMLGLLVAQALVGRLERRTRVGVGTPQ